VGCSLCIARLAASLQWGYVCCLAAASRLSVLLPERSNCCNQQLCAFGGFHEENSLLTGKFYLLGIDIVLGLSLAPLTSLHGWLAAIQPWFKPERSALAGLLGRCPQWLPGAL
jgi:hypothetical protein